MASVSQKQKWVDGMERHFQAEEKYIYRYEARDHKDYLGT